MAARKKKPVEAPPPPRVVDPFEAAFFDPSANPGYAAEKAESDAEGARNAVLRYVSLVVDTFDLKRPRVTFHGTQDLNAVKHYDDVDVSCWLWFPEEATVRGELRVNVAEAARWATERRVVHDEVAFRAALGRIDWQSLVRDELGDGGPKYGFDMPELEEKVVGLAWQKERHDATAYGDDGEVELSEYPNIWADFRMERTVPWSVVETRRVDDQTLGVVMQARWRFRAGKVTCGYFPKG